MTEKVNIQKVQVINCENCIWILNYVTEIDTMKS